MESITSMERTLLSVAGILVRSIYSHIAYLCLSSDVRSRVGKLCLVLFCSLAVPSLALHGAFSCPPRCLLLPSLVPSKVPSLALHGAFSWLQGAFSCTPLCLLVAPWCLLLAPGCLLLPSAVPSLALHGAFSWLQGAFSCLQGAFSCPSWCLLSPSMVPSLALHGAFSCPPYCLLLPSMVPSSPSMVPSLAHQGALSWFHGAFSCPLWCLLQLPSMAPSLAPHGAFSCLPWCLLLPSTVLSLASRAHHGFLNGAVSGDVAKPLTSMALSFQQRNPLSLVFVLRVRNTEESFEAFNSKRLYASLCLSCQNHLASKEDGDCSVELKLDLEADVSAPGVTEPSP